MSQSLFTEVDDRSSLGNYKESIACGSGIVQDASDKNGYVSKGTGPGGVPICQLPIADVQGGINGDPTAGFVAGKNFTYSEEAGGFVETKMSLFNVNVSKPSPTVPAKAPKSKRGKVLQAIVEDKPMPREYVKVALQGSFGKFTGKYIDVVQEDQLLVLVQESLEDGFVPPISEDSTIKMSWIIDGEPNVYEVFFLGLQYTSKVLGMTSFIFHIAGE